MTSAEWWAGYWQAVAPLWAAFLVIGPLSLAGFVALWKLAEWWDERRWQKRHDHS